MIRRICSILLDLLYPRKAVCMGCGAATGCERNDICEDCRTGLAKNRVGPKPAPKKSGLDGMAFAYTYAGPAGAIVRNLKYGSVKVLAEDMSRDIAAEARLLRLKDIYAVTSVPMDAARLRRRGFNQSEILARGVARELGFEYRELLCRTKRVKQQARLTRSQRLGNLKNVFAVTGEEREKLQGKRILLIDDVMTTGATAEECAAVLKKSGAIQVCFAAYAISEGRGKNGENHEHKK